MTPTVVDEEANMPEREEPPRSGWTVDKHIPIALLVGMGGQLLAGIIAATLLYADVREHDRRIDRLEIADRESDLRARALSDALIRLTATTEALRETVADLRSAVRALSPPVSSAPYPDGGRTPR